MAVNTLTQPGGYIPNGQTRSSLDPSGGTLEDVPSVGSAVHRALPHKEPAKK